MSERRKHVVLATFPQTGITKAFGPVFSLDAAERLLVEVERAGWFALAAVPVVVLESVAEFRADGAS